MKTLQIYDIANNNISHSALVPNIPKVLLKSIVLQQGIRIGCTKLGYQFSTVRPSPRPCGRNANDVQKDKDDSRLKPCKNYYQT